jgi:hypothetical protein
MTASVGRKVQANRLFTAALEGALAQTEDAGGEDFGDLGEAVGEGEVRGRVRVSAVHAIRVRLGLVMSKKSQLSCRSGTSLDLCAADQGQ